MTQPTAEHQQRAFELLHRPDWPAHTLADLLAVARHIAMVNGLAQRLANGHGISLPANPTDLADQAPPSPTLRACDFPPRRSGNRAAGQTERRRRDSRIDGPDLKRMAAGDRDDA